MCVVYRVEALVLVSAAYFYHFYIFYVQKLFIQIRFSELWIYFSALCNDVIFLFKTIAKNSYFYRIFCVEIKRYILLKLCVNLCLRISANRWIFWLNLQYIFVRVVGSPRWAKWSVMIKSHEIIVIYMWILFDPIYV